MQVCKCAMRIVRGNLVFLLVYIVGLSFMGLFMAQSFSFDKVDVALDQDAPDFAIVDRDDSELSRALAAFLDGRGIAVEVEDSRLAFQDAVAKGEVDYLLVVPEGFGAAFREAALQGGEAPRMDVVYSFYEANGALMDEVVDAYLGCVRTLMVANPDASAETVLAGAAEAMAHEAPVSVIDTNAAASEADRLVFFLQWSTYTLFAGVVVCVGLLVSKMNRADVRRRNLASPLSYASYNGQLAFSCGAIALASAVWVLVLGLIAFPEAASSIGAGGLALCAVAVAVYALMALSFGFMVAQLGANAMMCNAVGNIVGLVISFFGGAWVSLDLLSPEVAAVAWWLPGMWYTEACRAAASAGSAATGDVLLDVGMLALFAVAFLSVGFTAARHRMQTAAAGGNRAAETPVW